MSVTVTAIATVTASARSILGPLLTTFTPPRACRSYGGPSTNLESGYQAQSCSDAIVVDDASCWPAASVSAPSPRLNGWGFYSPGTVCPSGYMVSCRAEFSESTVNTDSETTSVGLPPNFDFQFPLAAGETAVGCCPEGFSCYKYTDSKFQTCISSITSGLFSVGYCDTTSGSGPLTNFQPEKIPSDVTVDVNPSHGMGGEVSTATLYAPMVQINWQATDTGGTAAAKTTSSIASATSTSGSSTNVAASTSAGTSQQATPTSNPSSGLSTGAKAAIGVVVPVVVLAVLAALGFWLLRRRRRNRAVAPEVAPMSTSIEHYAPTYGPKQELDASMSRQELETPRPELRGDRAHRPPQELST